MVVKMAERIPSFPLGKMGRGFSTTGGGSVVGAKVGEEGLQRSYRDVD